MKAELHHSTGNNCEWIQNYPRQYKDKSVITTNDQITNKHSFYLLPFSFLLIRAVDKPQLRHINTKNTTKCSQKQQCSNNSSMYW